MNSETSKIYIQHLLANSLSELKLTSFLNEIQISQPDPKFGDYSSNAGLILAKQLKMSPAQVAEKIIESLKRFDVEKRLESIESAGGFINFRLSQKDLLKNLQKIVELKELYGAGVSGNGEKILVEYFQPNVAKPLHLGHLRTAIIGDCLFRVMRSQGFKVESDTHLGDWGTQFGLLLFAFKKYGNLSIIEKDPISELNKLYVQVNAEIEKTPQLRDEGKAEFVKLEKGDEENRRLWKQFKDWSWQEYEIIYSGLGVRKSDHDWPESFFEDKMPAVLEELKEKKLLVESQGAQIVDLSNYNLGTAVLVKSDGGTTYLLRDLATYIFRKAQGFARQFYVVDVRQSHTLSQTFKIMELLGYVQNPVEAMHIGYGFLTLPEGAMSTRKGTVVGAKEFICAVQQRALEIINEKNPGLQDKIKIANSVATASIKYFDLSHNIKTDIVFDPKKAISFEGNTGPYLQYAYARIQGILRKSEIRNPKSEINFNPPSGGQILNFIPGELSDFELPILRKLLYFPEITMQVSQDFLPNLLCNYLFELSQTFNSFYQEVPVLAETDVNKKEFRLSLVFAVAQVLSNGLYLLGIEAVEEM